MGNIFIQCKVISRHKVRQQTMLLIGTTAELPTYQLNFNIYFLKCFECYERNLLNKSTTVFEKHGNLDNLGFLFSLVYNKGYIDVTVKVQT